MLVNKGDTIFYRILKKPTASWYESRVFNIHKSMQKRKYSVVNSSPHFPYTATVEEVEDEIERTLIQVFNSAGYSWYALDELEYIIKSEKEISPSKEYHIPGCGIVDGKGSCIVGCRCYCHIQYKDLGK